MKRICLSLLATAPLVLCQDYEAPVINYDQTAPTCKNVDKLIEKANEDLSRLKNYVTVTLPARITKLDDAQTSIKKTCDIISDDRPSLIQMSSFLKRSSAGPSNLCGDVDNSVNALRKYLEYLIPTVDSQYVQDKLPKRIESLDSFQEECELIASYDFYPTLDSAGGDITNLGGKSVVELMAWCSANPQCKGLNNNGWVKSTLQPKNTWTQWTNDATKGFYVKKGVEIPSGTPATPTILQGYTFHAGLDSGGNDITLLSGQTPAQLKQYCDSRADCKGFNTNGYVKHTLNAQNTWTRWTNDAKLGFYVKNAPAVSYTFHAGLDSGGGDITNLGGKTVDEMKAWCTANPSCKGFNTNGWMKSTIQPRNAWYQWTTNPNLGFYLKN